MPYFDTHASSAAGLVERLNNIYEKYIEDWSRLSAEKGASAMFAGWFSNRNSAENPLHKEFLDNVENTLLQLAGVLSRMDAMERGIYAAKAVERVLAPTPKSGKSAAEWYMLAAEYYCEIILPFLTRDDLKRFRDAFLKATPKRLMLPKERELLKKMEDIMAQ